MEFDEVHKRLFEDLDALQDGRALSVIWSMVDDFGPEQSDYVRKLHSAVATVRDIMAHEDTRESFKALARISLARDQASVTIRGRPPNAPMG